MTYTNHSGGCPGSDMEWENQGLKYGVKTIAYSFGNHVQYGRNQCKLTQDQLNEGYEKCKIAAETLKRPWKYIENKPYVKNLLARNWFQVKNADCIYAIGRFVKGSKKMLVDGGTGWAVQMAIDNNKHVRFFEQDEDYWYRYDLRQFLRNMEYISFHEPLTSIPTLTENFAGVGTREINENGKRAISDVYKRAFGT
jgi:hypothetical protein